MEYGVHLPLIAFDSRPYSLDFLLRYTETAARLGFQTLAVNDHLVFSRPWLDGLTALAAVLTQTGRMKLATTVALPVVRGPVALVKALTAIDLLAGGRLVVGVGAGSSARDYAAVSVPFDERWKRLEETVLAMRTLWTQREFTGQFYSTDGLALAPLPAQNGGPPIWIGSWGSEMGLRRIARLGDGWLASGYNTTPALFGDAWNHLQQYLLEVGKNPTEFPNAIATMFFYITNDKRIAKRVIQEVLAPALNRPEDVLRQRLPIGSAEECAEKLAAYQQAQRIFLWPVTDELYQLEAFQERVAPLAGGLSSS